MRLPLGPTVTAVALVAAGVQAQAAGSIRGTAYDKDFDAPVAGAQVSIVETGQKVETNDQGAFVFAQLRPGTYTLVVAKDGYLRQVRADVVVSSGQLTELTVSLAGDFTDMEEFVVQDVLRLGAEGETSLLDLRLESPALMNSISSEVMSRAGASDAASALRLVSGASLQDGKTAVIRGMPDRYVSSLMNGVRLPSADDDKRAVELDQFPSEVISSIQVSKSFTPDQNGDASGGAVDVRLKGLPDEPFFLKFNVQTSHNTQVTGRSRFLTYKGGGINYWGGSSGSRDVQELGESWEGAVGVTEADAPIDYKWSGAIGGKFEIAPGVRLGGFASVFYERDSSYFDNGVEDSWVVRELGDPMTPATSQGNPQSGDFLTSLFDVTQGKQMVQWGGLQTIGLETDEHALALTYLTTNTSEDTATLAEDTRGKEYFFPGHDPDVPTTPGHENPGGAPYLRFQTLQFTERVTETLQLTGRHRIPYLSTTKKTAAELDWTVARSEASRDEPDKRQFSEAWVPSGVYLPVRPAASFSLGNLQRTYRKIEEDSEQFAVNLKLPFTQWSGDAGYLKVGFFTDKVNRKYDQDTFSNFGDDSSAAGQFDELDWSDFWEYEDHPITASSGDVDYRGRQKIEASYAMLDLPLADRLNLIGGVRLESTRIEIVNDPENGATWLPPGEFSPTELLPGEADVDLGQHDVLPSIGVVHRPWDAVTLRASYSETLARPTFKELTPILQSEYLGGPVFIGNPEVELSSVRNYDVRIDYVPLAGGLLSASWFQKDIKDPIEYVEKLATFTYTTAVNYPRGTLGGIELEARQALGTLVPDLEGLTAGGNVTWIDGKVNLPDDEILSFIALHGVAPSSTRDMTSAPDYLFNLYLTYDIAATGTQFGAFYTVQGDTLVSGPGPSNDFYVPPTYETRYDTLNLSLAQRLGSHLRLVFAAKNLTNSERREVYRSEYIEEDVLRRSYTEGIEYSLTLGGDVRF